MKHNTLSIICLAISVIILSLVGFSQIKQIKQLQKEVDCLRLGSVYYDTDICGVATGNYNSVR